jgi:thymidylate synthase
MNLTFKNANDAFIYYYYLIRSTGSEFDNTKALFNQSFTILNPLDRNIQCEYRKWNLNYAEYEYQWYLSKNRSVEDIKKIAKIWDKMHNGDNIVNSNYGYQWSRNNQLDYVINELKTNPLSRKACISIYDGKEHAEYKYDTPCTLSIVFYIQYNKLQMSVYMRSNDLWFGFCNDQYCFSKLMEYIANQLNIGVGAYYHSVTNLHVYNDKLNKNI